MADLCCAAHKKALSLLTGLAAPEMDQECISWRCCRPAPLPTATGGRGRRHAGLLQQAATQHLVQVDAVVHHLLLHVD